MVIIFFIVCIAILAYTYFVLYPKMANKLGKQFEEYATQYKGREDELRKELLDGPLQYYRNNFDGPIHSMVSSSRHLTTEERAKEMLASAGRRLASRALGGSSRDYGKTTYFAFLGLDDDNLYYLEHENGEDNIRKKMTFPLSSISNLTTKPNKLTQQSSITFTQGDKEYRFDYYPNSLISFGGSFSQEARELQMKALIALIEPFNSAIEKMAKSSIKI